MHLVILMGATHWNPCRWVGTANGVPLLLRDVADDQHRTKDSSWHR